MKPPGVVSGLIMKWPWAILVCSAGCSSAPVADTLDWLRPAAASPDRAGDYAAPPRRPLPPENNLPIPRGPVDRPALPASPDDNGPPPLPPPPNG